jgi:hypothetical protein
MLRRRTAAYRLLPRHARFRAGPAAPSSARSPPSAAKSSTSSSDGSGSTAIALNDDADVSCRQLVDRRIWQVSPAESVAQRCHRSHRCPSRASRMKERHEQAARRTKPFHKAGQRPAAASQACRRETQSAVEGVGKGVLRPSKDGEERLVLEVEVAGWTRMPVSVAGRALPSASSPRVGTRTTADHPPPRAGGTPGSRREAAGGEGPARGRGSPAVRGRGAAVPAPPPAPGATDRNVGNQLETVERRGTIVLRAADMAHPSFTCGRPSDFDATHREGGLQRQPQDRSPGPSRVERVIGNTSSRSAPSHVRGTAG